MGEAAAAGGTGATPMDRARSISSGLGTCTPELHPATLAALAADGANTSDWPKRSPDAPCPTRELARERLLDGAGAAACGISAEADEPAATGDAGDAEEMAGKGGDAAAKGDSHGGGEGQTTGERTATRTRRDDPAPLALFPLLAAELLGESSSGGMT